MSNESETSRTEAMTEATSAVATASREQARDVGDTAKQQAQEVMGAARDEMHQLGDAAVGHAQDVLGDMRAQLRERADEQGTHAAQALHDASGQLQRMAQSGESGVLVDVARSAATRIDDVASRLEREGFDGILNDVRSYARRRPGMFLLAAGAAGFVVGRVVRNASSAISNSGPNNEPSRGQSAPPAMTRPNEPSWRADRPIATPDPAPPLVLETDFVGAATPSLTEPEA